MAWGDVANLGIILVAYGNEDVIIKMLDRLATEKQDKDFIVLIDNHPDHGCAAIAEKHPAADKVIRSENVGFAKGCNIGEKELPEWVDTLLLLNPDALPEKGAIHNLRSQVPGNWAAWMALLTLPNQRVNSAGNVLHVSGLSWCNGYNEPVTKFPESFEVIAASGACMAVRRSVWLELGGFEEDYFMYYEDTDLSFRIKMLGYKIGLIPAAHIEHDYEFNKSKLKWFYLERNRSLFILRIFPWSVILILLPLLILSELGLWLISILQGRFITKLRATHSFCKLIPNELIKRHNIQKTRKISSKSFINMLQADINTPLLGQSQKLSFIFSLYLRATRYILN